MGALALQRREEPPERRSTDERFWTRRTLWHWRSVLRFVRKHPERLLAIK